MLLILTLVVALVLTAAFIKIRKLVAGGMLFTEEYNQLLLAKVILDRYLVVAAIPVLPLLAYGLFLLYKGEEHQITINNALAVIGLVLSLVLWVIGILILKRK